MHRSGTKHIVRHMQKSVIQWSVISKFTCITHCQLICANLLPLYLPFILLNVIFYIIFQLLFFSRPKAQAACVYYLKLSRTLNKGYLSISIYLYTFTTNVHHWICNQHVSLNPSNAEVTFIQSTKIFENYLNPVMLVFIG